MSSAARNYTAHPPQVTSEKILPNMQVFSNVFLNKTLEICVGKGGRRTCVSVRKKVSGN